MRLLVQIYSTDEKDYINEHKDFYFLYGVTGEQSEITHAQIQNYIEDLLCKENNNKIVIKKYERE